ncbi:hypothetical protein [Streptomyces anulatus]
MALEKQISLGELKRRNDASQTARATEKAGSGSNSQQQKGR